MKKLLILLLLFMLPFSINASNINRCEFFDVTGHINDFLNKLDDKNNIIIDIPNHLLSSIDYDKSINNSETYLFNISPFFIENGNIKNTKNSSNTLAGIRPIIHIKDVNVSGKGTVDDPFMIDENVYTIQVNVINGVEINPMIVKRGVKSEVKVSPNDGYDVSKYELKCEDGIVANLVGNKLKIKDARKSGSCELAFLKSLDESIISANTNKAVRNAFSTIFNTDNNGNTIYYESNRVLSDCNSSSKYTYVGDGLCKTYYFAGKVTNNYVSFAGFIWRIIRINENGTIRLILDNPTNSLVSSPINSNYTGDYNYYSNCEDNSCARNVLNQWYMDYLNTYDDKISSSKFCEDFKCSEVDGSSNNYRNYVPSFDCSNVINSKIGLITYDEVIYAGGYPWTVNSSYYLNFNKNYWTMSPSGNGTSNWVVNSTNISTNFGNSSNDLRPVISLKSDVLVSGSGFVNDPYVIH